MAFGIVERLLPQFVAFRQRRWLIWNPSVRRIDNHASGCRYQGALTPSRLDIPDCAVMTGGPISVKVRFAVRRLRRVERLGFLQRAFMKLDRIGRAACRRILGWRPDCQKA